MGGGIPGCSTVPSMRIWLDTDIGTDVDDALALAYVLRRPDLELVGISTVFGDVTLRTRIAEALLALAGPDPVPVLTGLGVPLAERRHGIMFGHEGRGLLADPRPVLRIREEQGAAQRVAELGQAMAAAEPDVLVAIGPMTNVGALAAGGTELPPLAVMGGRFEDVVLPGMGEEITEWNWHCDPQSVQRVLAVDHRTPPLVIPAEVTFRTRLRSDDIDRLADGDALGRALAGLCREWLALQRERFGVEQPIVALHDPLTTAVLSEADLCRYRECRITVDDRAATTEASDPRGPVGTAVRVATAVDAEAARRHIMDVLTENGS